MKIKTLLISVLLLAFSSFSYADRIKDLASIAGVRNNQLVGYGLVVGLNGTGDKTKFTGQSLRSMLREMGVTLPPGTDPKSKNVALGIDKMMGCSNRGHAIATASTYQVSTGKKLPPGENVNGGVKVSHLAEKKCTTKYLYSRDRLSCQ